MLSILCMVICLGVGDAVDAAMADAGRFPGGGEAYVGQQEDLQAWSRGTRQLRDLARNCPQAEWPGLRARLVQRLDDPNRGIWYASLAALAARGGDDAVELLTDHVRSQTDPDRRDLATRLLSRAAENASEAARRKAAEDVAAMLNDTDATPVRKGLVLALGRMGPPAFDALLAVEEQPTLAEGVRPELIQAFAATGDGRAVRPLLRMHAQAPEGQRIAVTLALGGLLRSTGANVADGPEAEAVLRRDLLKHSSPAAAGAAAFALARAGLLSADTPEARRVVDLLDEPDGRVNALRAVHVARLPLGEGTMDTMRRLADSTNPDPLSRKVAGAVLMQHETLDSPTP
ncbi:MAG: hypothetical protein JXB13_18135 [Phycisphaerae bacterium]|nr:hypothetical protein [Phycisphaerae bacterium]